MHWICSPTSQESLFGYQRMCCSHCGIAQWVVSGRLASRHCDGCGYAPTELPEGPFVGLDVDAWDIYITQRMRDLGDRLREHLPR